MKKIALTFVALVMTVGMFAENDLKINFCGDDSKTIDEQELLKCNELTVNSDVWKIKSLSIGFMSGDDYVEAKLEGNKMTKALTEKIKAVSPEYLYIEKIVLVNNKGEEMKLGHQKLIITE